jgi:hypothetical protein
MLVAMSASVWSVLLYGFSDQTITISTAVVVFHVYCNGSPSR